MSIISTMRGAEMMRAVRTVAPPPVKMPRVPSGRAKKVLLSATRTWAALASSRPPPTTAPCRQAMTGMPPCWILSNARCQPWHTRMNSTPLRALAWCSFRSRPAQKCSPRAISTMARMCAGTAEK